MTQHVSNVLFFSSFLISLFWQP